MRRFHTSHMRGLVGFALTVSVMLLPSLRVQAADPLLRLESARVAFSGTSNMHPYEASTTTVRVTRLRVSPVTSGDAIDALTRPGGLEGFDIAIPAATLTSPQEGFDKNMHQALKVDRYADITFGLSRIEPGDVPQAFRGVGRLTIAGVERTVTLDLAIRRVGSRLEVKGTCTLLMTDYGITPPKAALGMWKTDPEVTIAFDLVFSVRTT